MARTLNASFVESKNALERITPIKLLAIEYADSAASVLYWAAWNKNVDYFQPNTATAQTYTAAPIDISDINYTSVESAPSMTVTVADVDRTFGAYLEQNDGLRGRGITVLKVFEELLTNASANISEKFYVDGSQSGRGSVTVALVPKTTVYNITVPSRVYRRNQCQWEFKTIECLGTTTIATPAINATLASSLITTCLKTLASCDSYNNTSRYGGFPGLPRKRIIIT